MNRRKFFGLFVAAPLAPLSVIAARPPYSNRCAIPEKTARRLSELTVLYHANGYPAYIGRASHVYIGPYLSPEGIVEAYREATAECARIAAAGGFDYSDMPKISN